ncbi:MAG TPA: carbamoyltransferase HypF [Casimicrobiaceae bacterium]|nr:carbamoyltransferase HypF [Casimicrobiaceae bacterium]
MDAESAMAIATAPERIQRRRFEVAGVVQGVGFRPFVYRLARELSLAGWVNNDGGGVVLEVEGDPANIDTLRRRLALEAPAQARIDRIAECDCAVSAQPGFAILESERTRATTAIGPDIAICGACLRELFDPRDRRYRYAFVNCTHCGPRYTITRSLPYDRATTSMAPFVQCRECASEYRDPDDRRFHAEPNACPRCGPNLELVDAAGAAVACADPIAETLARLRAGEIVAVKGLGGFHLVCDARNSDTVARLRSRKARDEKPFAVMVASVASLSSLADVGHWESALLESAERPIVLLRKRGGVDDELRGVAPGLAWLGAMLPYTPLQYLLFNEAADRPTGTEWLGAPQDLVLVTTSANPGGEPLVTDNAEALRRLSGIADAWLVHNRAIVTRCDDSVLRAGGDHASCGLQFVRRARGYTPRAIRLRRPGPSVVALGGYFKNTVCVTRGDEAFVSQHIGDLDNAPTCAALVDAVEHLLRTLEVTPEIVAHDLHPDFFSTRHAARLAHARDIALRGVQHHHAHIAAVLAEHRGTGPALGLALDGVGLGTDGGIWGGELLRVDGARCERMGRLAPLRLPGGDVAAREPWRMAAAALARCGRGNEISRRFADEPAAATVASMLTRNVNTPVTSSMGRVFDAAAGLLGVRRRSAFEGQAAMLLEGLADRRGGVAPDDTLFAISEANELDLGPLLARLADEHDAAFGAALFHATAIRALGAWVARSARAGGIGVVACAGGCFLNAILARGLRTELAAHGLSMLEAMAVPPNDGGLSLGQAWVAMQSSGLDG